MRKATIKAMILRAKVLNAVKNGIKTASAIYKETNIKYADVIRNLTYLENYGCVSRKKIGVRGLGKSTLYHYEFLNDNHNILEQYYSPKDQVEFPQTPYLQKMFGINTHHVDANAGVIYKEQHFTELKRKNQYKSWNPSKPKSHKTYVSGSTLTWL